MYSIDPTIDRLLYPSVLCRRQFQCLAAFKEPRQPDRHTTSRISLSNGMDYTYTSQEHHVDADDDHDTNGISRVPTHPAQQNRVGSADNSSNRRGRDCFWYWFGPILAGLVTLHRMHKGASISGNENIRGPFGAVVVGVGSHRGKSGYTDINNSHVRTTSGLIAVNAARQSGRLGPNQYQQQSLPISRFTYKWDHLRPTSRSSPGHVPG